MLFETFRRIREEAPHSVAFLITSGDRALPITWRQFTDDIDLVVRLIKVHAPGARIALLGENSYEWMVSHAAIIFSGATVVPLDMDLSSDEIAARLKYVGASALVYSSLYGAKAAAVARKIPGLIVAAFGSIKTERFLSRIRSAFRPSDSIWRDAPAVPADATSMIMFTSGTTSSPRGAELTIRGIEAFVDSAMRVLNVQPGSRSLMLLPLHHIFGLCTSYFMLCSGVALGVCPDFRRIFDAVERFRASFLFLVPALAEILASKIVQRGRSAEEALGFRIDWILTGGAPMPRRTYERVSALGVKLISGYGLTETTSLYSLEPTEGVPRIGSAGFVSRNPLVETSVSPEGELLIRGPSVMKGYFRAPDKTAAAIDADGWFHTGDIGRIDADGCVWIVGRASRTIVLSSGKKVAPEELESLILAIPGVLEAVVTGDGEAREIKAEIYGTIPERSVVRAVGQLNLELPVYKRIKHIVVRTEPFPRTASGKIKVS